jgi:cysteinyl-tRNA synthetase
MKQRHTTCDTIIDAIGNTPMVEIKSLNPNPNVKIYAKLEYMNPGGSIKDRAALYMIKAGEESGALTKDKIVIEATSGNTGIGLAMICAVKGYKLLLTMSEAVSEERRKILRARGADIMPTPGHLGTDGAIEEVYRLVREHPGRYFMTDQYNNEANFKAHYYETAPEIWEQTGGRITTLVATMGTTGTLMGLSRRLKEYNPDIRIVGMEPFLGHKIQGLKNLKEAYCPEIFDKKRLDKKVNVEDEEAYEMARQLARREGIFVGMSSGAAMVAARNEAAAMKDGVIVVILPDGGERYLSTSLFAVQEKASLCLFNMLHRKKEAFNPIVPGSVSIYTCGPTAHARMHLSECRRFVSAELLRSYLAYRGFKVNHVINITDLDDKTIEGAQKADLDLARFTEGQIEWIMKDLALLGIEPADEYPKTSDHVAEMIRMSENLVKKGFAYEKLRSIYFNLSRSFEYGTLSGVDVNKIRIGATVDLDEYEKDNPRDFTLLKRSTLSELRKGIFFKTEWGNIRPSWHIQSAAIALKYLGEQFDIHTSSLELAFPHHENEIAISRALTGKVPARYWVHCERVLADDGKKVDEATELTLDTLTRMGYTGREIRYWLISGHYRKPITFSPDRLEHARRSLKRLDACIHALMAITEGNPFPELNQLIYDLKQGFAGAMDQDLNISPALASIFQVVKRINRLVMENRIDTPGARKLLDAFQKIDTVLKIFDFGQAAENERIQTLLKDRREARLKKNWELADRIRDELQTMGIQVRDGKLK